MYNSSHSSLADKTFKASIALQNGLLPDILNLLMQVGYTEAKIAEGKERIDLLNQSVYAVASHRGLQLQATEEVRTLFTQSYALFATSRAVAKIAFRGNPEATTALGLSTPIKQSISGHIEQAQLFYGNILQDYRGPMVELGYSKERLQEEQLVVLALIDAVHHQQTCKGKSQQATKERNDLTTSTFKWMSDYYALAKIALAGHPQWREKLGMLERS